MLTGGEGVKNTENFADVLYGWSPREGRWAGRISADYGSPLKDKLIRKALIQQSIVLLSERITERDLLLQSTSLASES